MNAPRWTLLVALLVVIVAGTWFALSKRTPNAVPAHLIVYYTKIDGTTLGDMSVSLRARAPGESAAEHRGNVALYAAVEAVAGPPSEVQAVRFPPGTRVNGVTVTGTTATVDFSREIENPEQGDFGENGEFKGLVYTLTGLPNVDAVAITVDGKLLQTLPGGSFELDKPLHRSDW